MFAAIEPPSREYQVSDASAATRQSGRRALLCLNVQKHFGEIEVVRDLSLSVSEGEILALLGSSGCGKTTTLRLIAGLERVDGGCIEIDGELVAGAGLHTAPERRRIGMVFQDYALFPHLSVGRNVGFGLGRGTDSQRRVDEALDLVGLAGFGDRMPQELSGGQQQRVALARALAPKPRVLLMDEPFSNLDPDLRANVRSEVRDILREAGATAVLVTHDQEEALSMADQVALMMHGAIVQRADPETLYRRPATRQVAGFIGESLFLPGTASGHGAETEIGRLELVDPHIGAVDVLLRPEALELATSQGDDPVAGTIVRREYYGRYQSLSVRLRSGVVLKATGGTGMTFRVGDAVRVTAREPLLAYPGIIRG
jgi:iron(III) transport system ATP-binding protein